MCWNFLKLKSPEKYVEFTQHEPQKDRNNVLDFMRFILNDTIKFESELINQKFDDPPIDVTCAIHLGKGFSQCTDLAKGRDHWKVLYGTFKKMPEIWGKHLGKAALANHGNYKACFEVQSNNTLNDIQKQVRGFSEWGRNWITIDASGVQWYWSSLNWNTKKKKKLAKKRFNRHGNRIRIRQWINWQKKITKPKKTKKKPADVSFSDSDSGSDMKRTAAKNVHQRKITGKIVRNQIQAGKGTNTSMHAVSTISKHESNHLFVCFIDRKTGLLSEGC
jgi:hypothetical protein